MAAHRLPNYLKSVRKKLGLRQSEVAFLLGNKNGAQLSRYEKHHQIPSLQIAFALEKIFGAPLAELFAGVHDSVKSEVSARIDALICELRNQSATTPRFRKSRWLEEHDRTVANRDIHCHASLKP